MLLYSSPAFAAHATPQGHPERPDRHAVVMRALQGRAVHEARPAPVAEILRCHPQDYFDRIAAALPSEGIAQIDGDTFLSPLSLEAALCAVGAACDAVDAVIAGEDRRAFVACRPPGHHAETARAMGFCIFGTIAIAAKRALDHHGLSRVAVLDFDVHHGNGTQDLLWDDPRAMFVSSHEMPLFPGSGSAREAGAHGQVVNLPLASGSDGAAMRRAWGPALARVEAFAPELILISAGFDAHADDPLATLDWQVEDFRWLSAAIIDVADRVCGGRVVSALEGGYDLAALEASVAAHVKVLERE